VAIDSTVSSEFDLERWLNASAVTIVGASVKHLATPQLIQNLLSPDTGFVGPLHLVNRSRPVIGNHKVMTDVAQVEGDPGIVFLLTPRLDWVELLRRMDHLPSGVVIHSSGAASGESAEFESKLVKWSRETGVPVLGPQSAGFLSLPRILASTIPVSFPLLLGKVGLIVQSGGILHSFLQTLNSRGIGVSCGFAVGLMSVLNFRLLAEYMLTRDDVQIILAYLDGISDPKDLVTLGKLARERGKYLVLVVGGQSEAGQRAAASHSGALTTPHRVVAGVARQYGIFVASTLDEAVWTVEVLLDAGFEAPASPGIAAFTGSGGAAITFADGFGSRGGILADLEEAKQTAGLTDEQVANPVDLSVLAAGVGADVENARRQTLSALIGDQNIGICAWLSSSGIPFHEPSGHMALLQGFLSIVRGLNKTAVVVAPAPMAPDHPKPKGDWQGVVVGYGIVEASAKLLTLARWADMQRELSGASAKDETPDNPEQYPEAHQNASELAAVAAPGSGVVISGAQARQMLHGLPGSYPRTVVVDKSSAIDDVISTLAYPVVLKSESGLLHREASGGVLQGIRDVESAGHGVRYLNSRFGGAVEIMEEVSHRTEYIVGYKREPGYTLGLVGRGGTGVSDAQLLVTPINRVQLICICRQLADPADNPEQLADLVLAVTLVGEAVRWIDAIDLNPVVFNGDRIYLLDVKIHVDDLPADE
jgi:acyl-CoA synthetase (NDP forming)